MFSANTLPLCTGAKTSFVSYNGKSESLIDHILIQSQYQDLINKCCVLDDNCLNVSAHRPILVELSIHIEKIPNQTCFKSIKWNKVTPEQLAFYRNAITEDFEQCNAATDQSSITTPDQILDLYDKILNVIKKASETHLPRSKFRKFLKPYWNKALKDSHASMRNLRRIWISEGRPRGCEVNSYLRYKRAKCVFRRLHSKASEDFLRKEHEEIDRAAGIDINLFWRLFNSKGKKKMYI